MKVTVKKLASWCLAQGLASDSMSGDRSQAQRVATIRKFKEGRVKVVIATDVAARGLDIKGIERVINYELPTDDFQVTQRFPFTLLQYWLFTPKSRGKWRTAVSYRG
jgi:ATP-dependent RNA helicase DeaD